MRNKIMVKKDNNNLQSIVVIPEHCEKAYIIAGNIFCEYWKKITGKKLQIKKSSANIPNRNLILIGNDSVNKTTHNLVTKNKNNKFNIKYGTDDYHILSIEHNKNDILVLAGGCGRSTIYAVYDFFRKCVGVEYFWDGDVILPCKNINISKHDFNEKPRFQYRGLRYFAHRGLHRFQAEHWNFDDWKKEIDWIMKKRFNIFMLRTGIDDLFQRAFPGKVPYPREDALDEDRQPRHFNDRTSPWSLKFRGDLRKKVLAYAFERGLMHPADVGTITHWYSHTPSSFFKSHPNFPTLKQRKLPFHVESDYNTQSLRVWDIHDDRTWDAYWKLTETSIKEYGKGQARIFHTIGLAERLFGKNHNENLQIKLFAIRKIQQVLREHYPDAPLLLATWDFLTFWEDKEIQTLIKELDPDKTIMLDYIADRDCNTSYKKWKYYKSFPWIFGIFHAFAQNTEIRGDYWFLSKRLSEAKKDPFCRGLVFWPELSHSDTFMLEFIAENSWDPVLTPEDSIKGFCRRRYPKKLYGKMVEIWNKTLNITKTWQWGRTGSVIISQFRILTFKTYTDLNNGKIKYFKKHNKELSSFIKTSPEIIKLIGVLIQIGYSNTLWLRDIIDISRTIIQQAIDVALTNMVIEMESWRKNKGSAEKIKILIQISTDLMKLLGDLLSESDEFSLYKSYIKLKETVEINPFTEETLKGNSENNYCRTQVFEQVRFIYEKELEVYCNWVKHHLEDNNKDEWNQPDNFEKLQEKIRDKFYKTPLSDMAPVGKHTAEGFTKTLKEISKIFNTLPI